MAPIRSSSPSRSHTSPACCIELNVIVADLALNSGIDRLGEVIEMLPNRHESQW
jgi:hypothetical protein